MASRTPVKQPRFDERIYKLIYPLAGGRSPKNGILKRGFMVQEKPLPGMNARATVHFLYNPSTVSATYPLSDSSVGAILQFPNPGDKADLRVPLYQTASWSVLYDRTYELWGSYNDNGTPKNSIGKDKNNPKVIGVLSDVYQFQQFTGMTIGYSSGGNPSKPTSGEFWGHQGIIQIVPGYVYFGDKQNLSYYGYVSEWDVQITHWTQFMVPMRCVINVTFTMLPPPVNQSKPGASGNNLWGQGPSPNTRHFTGGSFIPTPPTTGISGR